MPDLPTPAEIEDDHKAGVIVGGIAIISGLVIGFAGLAFLIWRMLG